MVGHLIWGQATWRVRSPLPRHKKEIGMASKGKNYAISRRRARRITKRGLGITKMRVCRLNWGGGPHPAKGTQELD